MILSERENKTIVLERLGIKPVDSQQKVSYEMPDGQKVQVSYSRGIKVDNRNRYLFAIHASPFFDIPHVVFICGSHDHTLVLHKQMVFDLIGEKLPERDKYWKVYIYTSLIFNDIMEIHLGTNPVKMQAWELWCRFDLLTGEKYWFVPNNNRPSSRWCFFCGNYLSTEKNDYFVITADPFIKGGINLLLNPEQRHYILGECCISCAWLSPKQRNSLLLKRREELADNLKAINWLLS